jgi:hypothetical protein
LFEIVEHAEPGRRIRSRNHAGGAAGFAFALFGGALPTPEKTRQFHSVTLDLARRAESGDLPR